MSGLSKTFISLRNRNYRLFFTGQLVSNTGNWLTNVALTLFVLKATHSGFDVGLLAACQYGPILFFTIWGGALADRSNKRRMLYITQSLEMLQSAALAVVAFLPHAPLVSLYALAVAGGFVLALDNPLRRSFVSEMVRAEDVPNAVVLYSATVNVSRIFGPALAGLLVITVGYGWCFAIDAASYIAVLICLFMMRPVELYTRPPRPRAKGEVREGLRYVASMPMLWISFVMLAAIGTLAYNFTVTLPLFVTDTLHSNGVVFTILYSVFSLGAVVGAFLIARRSLVRMQHVILGAAALGVTMLLLAFVSGVVIALPIVLLMGVASVLYTISTSTIAQTESKPEMHGRVLALQTVLMAGTTPIGGPLLGWLADVMGGRAPFIVGGIVCLLAAGFGLFATQRMIQSRTTRQTF